MIQRFSGFWNSPWASKTSIQIIALVALMPACVTAIAQQAPVIINQETGAQIDLIRPYWNANVDIANRSVVCDHFQFNSEAAVYELIPGVGWPGGDFYLSDEVFTHTPLGQDAEGTVRSGNLQNWTGNFRTPSWNVYDGIYTGLAPFNSHEHIEIVNYDPTTRLFDFTANNNAIRVWHSSDLVSPSTYSVCYDIDGAAFLPTGSASIGNTNLIDLVEVDFTFQFPQPLSGDEDAPVITRLDTGEQVEFVRGEWRYNDVPGMRCSTYRWASGRYETYGDNDGGEVLFITYYPFVGGATVATTTTSSSSYRNNGLPVTGTVRIEDFQFFDDGYMELVEDGFNLWRSEWPYGYMGCNVRPPNLVLPLQPDSCDYSTADQFDGYGWNPITRESCPPLEASETPVNVTPETPSGCDYSNAVNGWGWNETTRQSCPPLTIAEQQTTPQAPVGCDYSNAINGWGWNETTRQSCPPLTIAEQQTTSQAQLGCDYTNAINGWGWNESTRQSCPPLTEAEEQTTPQAPAGCDYSNAVNGWGWNETIRQSCEPL